MPSTAVERTRDAGFSLPLLNLAPLRAAAPQLAPYPHVIASGMLPEGAMEALNRDFPSIDRTGYLPLDALERTGAFDALLKELEGPEIARVVGEKLGVDLRDKPRMITIRKWSAIKDGRIHNDGEAKIVTALLYFNPNWQDTGDGRFRVLNSDTSFDDMAAEVSPVYGNFLAFRRTENSWHGHKPFAGERRVVQITWLRSQEDFERKNKRGKFSLLLKKWFLPKEY